MPEQDPPSVSNGGTGRSIFPKGPNFTLDDFSVSAVAVLLLGGSEVARIRSVYRIG